MTSDCSVCRILLIDDEKSLLKGLSILLERQGHHVDTALTGEEGLQKVAAVAYDMVITDLRMPGISGDQVLKEIKKMDNCDIPVVGMSGTPWLLDKELFDAVLEKPITQKELLSLIEKFNS